MQWVTTIARYVASITDPNAHFFIIADATYLSFSCYYVSADD